MKGMKKLILDLDFLNGPIVKNVFSESKNQLVADIDLIDNNIELNKLNEEIMKLYSSFMNLTRKALVLLILN